MRNSKPPDEKTPQGNPAPPGQGDGDPPKYVTEEQLNRAISARLGDFQKKFEKTIGDAIGGLGAKLEEVLQREPQTPPNGGGNGSGDDPKSIENHPLVKGLQKQLAETKALADKTAADRDAEKQKARDTSLRNRVTDALSKGGLDPKFVGHATGHLVDVSKRVRFADDDSDELVFRDGTTDVDFDTGLKSWMKTDDAKLYLPPRGTQGSGDRPGSKNTQQGQPAPSIGAALLGMVRPTTEQG